MNDPWIETLRKLEVGEVHTHVSLAPYTTWRIGGPADVVVIPTTKQAIARIVRAAQAYGEPLTTMGRGSNVLVTDAGIRGTVLLLGDALDYIHFQETTIVAGAAYSLIKLSVMAGRAGLSGLEFAGGIPGSVGGAVYMNAGAHGADMSTVVSAVEVVDEQGNIVRLCKNDLAFAYRHSVFHRRLAVIVEAHLAMQPFDRKTIAKAMATYKARRLQTQPLHLPCAGSVFRNPPEGHAAALIERAGLKGFRIGGAQVSPMHANFIINTQQATAKDVLALVAHIQQTVAAQSGVFLEAEIRVIGESAW